MALRKGLDLYPYPNKFNTPNSIKKEDLPHAG